MYKRADNTWSYSILGSPVCAHAIEVFWNISRYTRRLIEQSVRDQRPIVQPHGNSLIAKDAFKERITAAWFETFIPVCEFQPDSEEIHMLERLKKVDVYESCIHDLQQAYSPDELPGYSTFSNVWKKNYPHLKIPKHCRLGRCDVCCDLDEQIKNATGRNRRALLDKKTWHKHLCNKERSHMTACHARARAEPLEWTCLCTDWSNPHQMPHMAHQPKGWMTKKRLKYQLFGICRSTSRSPGNHSS